MNLKSFTGTKNVPVFFILNFLIASSPIVITKDSKLSDAPTFKSEFVVWNVGQGLFTSLIQADYCQHFDAGGEFFPRKKILSSCKNKANTLHLSHWDMDHINFSPSLNRLLHLCLKNLPNGEHTQRKSEMLSKIPDCKSVQQFKNKIPTNIPTSELKTYIPESKKKMSANDSSQVVLIRNSVLVSGDSTIKFEKIWSQRLRNARVFVLGHHGSRTSNSDEVFKSLRRPAMAVASARKRKYGHPHKEVLQRARQNLVPILNTEDWGSLHFEL